MVKIGNLRLYCKNNEEYNIALNVVKKYIKNSHHFTECKDFGTITIHDIKTYDEWGKIVNEINQQTIELKHGK